MKYTNSSHTNKSNTSNKAKFRSKGNLNNNLNNKNFKSKSKFNQNKKEIYNKFDNTKKYNEKPIISNQNSSKKNILISRYEKFFGKEDTRNLLSYENKLMNNQFIRVNLSKITVKKVEEFLTKNRAKFSKTFISNALKIEKSFFNISSSLLSINGSIYIQDLASQIPINLIDFKALKKKFEGKIVRVLDMAASPGSKTTQIADLLNFNEIKFEIVALEPDKKRLNRLINNLNKQEVENFSIYNVTGQNFKSDSKFDIILLDAPCSGNFIDDNNWFSKRDLSGIENNAKIQREILKNAKELLSDKGELIYSTCSLEPEENEFNVKWSIDNLSLKIVKSNFDFGFKTSVINIYKNQNSIRIMPNHSKTQGFFACKFTK